MTDLRARLRRNGEDGLTLVELLVVVAILAVVMTAMFSMTITIQRTARETNNRAMALGDARVTVDALSKNVRSAVRPDQDAPAFAAATAQRIEFCANVNRAEGAPWPLLVSYEVVGTDLVETITHPGTSTSQDCSGNDGDVRARVVADDLTQTSVFTFYGDVTDPEAAAADPGAAELSPPFDEDGRDRIRAVGYRLSVVDDPNGPVPPTVIEGRVRLANLDDVIIQES